MTTLFPHEELSTPLRMPSLRLKNLTVLSLTMPVWSGTGHDPIRTQCCRRAALPPTPGDGEGGGGVIDPSNSTSFRLCAVTPTARISGRRVCGQGLCHSNNLADAIMQKLELIINEYEHALMTFWPTTTNMSKNGLRRIQVMKPCFVPAFLRKPRSRRSSARITRRSSSRPHAERS